MSIANTVNPWLYKLNFDPQKSFAPIAGIVSSENVLAVNNDLPVKNVKEFIALAKQQQGKMPYASGGTGSSLHLAMELFKVTAGIDLVHIPFKGAGPGIIDVIGGHTKAINSTISSVSPHIRAGKLRALAVTGKNCNEALPDVPTFEESGVSGYERRQLDRPCSARRNARTDHREVAEGNRGDAGVGGVQEAARASRLRGSCVGHG